MFSDEVKVCPNSLEETPAAYGMENYLTGFNSGKLFKEAR